MAIIRKPAIFFSNEVGKEMTESAPLTCPHCGSEDMIKSGTTAQGKQRYCCKNMDCTKRTFLKTYSYKEVVSRK